ncbi:MAG: hypothetical protein QQN46_02000 [Nitrosopumilus sp.]
MFELINSIVQNFAKFLAFNLGAILTILIWTIGKIDTFFMVGISLICWVLYKIAILVTKSFSLILWVPEKLAIASFLFALDISPEEHKETMAAVEKEFEKEIHLKSFAVKRAAEAIQHRAEEEEAKNDPS